MGCKEESVLVLVPYSELLLFLQVLGALFLAIGLWAWGEKVREWGSGVKWEGDHPLTVHSPVAGCSLQHLSTDRSRWP